MGLILRFGLYPTPLHGTYNGLAAFVDVDVFDGDFLLPLGATQDLRKHESAADTKQPELLSRTIWPRAPRPSRHNQRRYFAALWSWDDRYWEELL